MQQLRKVLTQTTWANASDAINKNSDRIYEAITRVENATTKNKGYFETSNALLDTYPNPSVGDIAFVFNSANTVDTPYDVYKAAFSSITNTYEWYDSGINASFADVDINSVNDSIRDIEQQVDTLKDPRLPIICDANGRIGLNVGNGLYVDSNGDLCATQSIGGGGGSGSGGESYYAAAGISINEDNFISVKVGASLEFDNDNALKVGTGEGLVHNSNGKLSVNVGKGLVIDDKTNAIEIEEYNAIKEIPIAIQKKQDRLTQGSGIEITSESVINVDGSNLQVLLSTNAINDEDGNRIRATYAKKEEVGGIYEAIEATNTTVASHTQSIESLELNKQDKLDFGNGLETVGNLVKVEDAVLKDIADNKADINALGTTVETLSNSISGKQDKLTASDGINLDDGKLSVHIGTGLGFDPESSAVVVKVGAGIKTDINQSLTIKHDATLTTDADGQLGVNQGTITNIAASEVAKVVANAPANYDTLKEIADYIATDAEGAAQLSNRIGALESALPNKMDTIAFGSGLAFSSNVVKVADAVMTDIANNKSNIGKLQSSVDGLRTSKQDTISDLATIRSNAANGATAYGWGYHGTAGYAKKAKVNGSTYESDSNGVINLPSYPTTLPASDVYAWAKASSKPSYSWSEINNKPDVATKEDLNNKQDTLTFGSGLTNTNGVVTVDYKTASVKWSNISDKPTFATVATSGSYNDLSNKPTIPSAVTESTVSGWGFTKNTGTYSKPSGGIPKSDLDSSVQTSLNNADAAYGWGSHKTAGYAKSVRVNNQKYESDASGQVILPDYPTSLPANGGNAYRSQYLETLDSTGTKFYGDLYKAYIQWETNTTARLKCNDYTITTDKADKLSTPRYIWGQSFDGSDNVNGNAYMRKDLGANLDDWIAYQHNGPLEVGRASNAMCLAMGVTDDDIAYIQSKGNGITSSAPLVLQPADDGKYYYGGLYYSKHKYPILHTGNLSTYFTNGFENVGGTIKISTSYITEKIKGDGLVLDESGKMSVDSANLSVKNADTVGGLYDYDFVRRTNTQVFLPKFVLEDIPKNLTQVGSIGWEDYQNHPFAGGLFLTLKGISSLRTAMILFPDYALKEPPLLYSSIDNLGWQGGFQLAYRSDIPTSLPANGGNADTLDGHDSSYFATKNELGNKQNTLTFGSGIAHNNNIIWVDGSQLNVNYANSAGSVAWGNVSGRPSFGNGFDSTNNVVQLKLSTGLAIDDRGYLYVTGL